MAISYGIIALISISFLSMYFLVLKNKIGNEKLLKFLSILAFIGVGTSLFIVQAIDQTVEFEKGPFGKNMTIFMVLLRWCTTVVVSCGIFNAFFDSPSLKRIICYIMPIVTILNLMFLSW